MTQFKAGDRVWFLGRKYTLEAIDTHSEYVLQLVDDALSRTFTAKGYWSIGDGKPALKHVKRKSVDDIYIGERSIEKATLRCGVNTFITLNRTRSSDIRYVKAKDQKRGAK